jgi:hypothetical protein
MTDMWNNADPDAKGPIEEVTLEPPADGKVSAALMDVYAGESAKGPFISVTWKSLEDGYKWKVLGGFKSQGAANMAKKMIRDLGVDVDSIAFDQINEASKPRLGEYFNLTVKTNGSFRNTYIDGPASGGINESDLGSPAVPGEPVPVPAANDDVPF